MLGFIIVVSFYSHPKMLNLAHEICCVRLTLSERMGILLLGGMLLNIVSKV